MTMMKMKGVHCLGEAIAKNARPGTPSQTCGSSPEPDPRVEEVPP